MATLLISDRVVFTVTRDSLQQELLRFRIEEGYVNLQYAGVALLFNRALSNMQATELFYTVHLPSRSSIIGMMEERTIARNNMRIRTDEKLLTADILLTG